MMAREREELKAGGGAQGERDALTQQQQQKHINEQKIKQITLKQT